MTVTESNKWAGQELAARREKIKPKLTQDELADRAAIDRSVYNALENGRRRISRYYAEKLAPHLGVNPEKLLPPEVQPQGPANPLSRLAELEGEVAWLRAWVARGFDALGVAPELQDEARRALADGDE